jgi:hypothetical protein
LDTSSPAPFARYGLEGVTMDTHLVKLCFQNHQFVGKMLTQIHMDNLAMKIGDLMGYEWGFSDVFSV